MLTRSQTKNIQQDMHVRDVNGKPVGIVDYVYHGEQQADFEVVGLREMKAGMQTLMGSANDFPVAVYARFHRDGFARIQVQDFGVYFIPEQIHVIVGDNIYLRVAREDLLTAKLR